MCSSWQISFIPTYLSVLDLNIAHTLLVIFGVLRVEGAEEHSGRKSFCKLLRGGARRTSNLGRTGGVHASEIHYLNSRSGGSAMTVALHCSIRTMGTATVTQGHAQDSQNTCRTGHDNTDRVAGRRIGTVTSTSCCAACPTQLTSLRISASVTQGTLFNYATCREFPPDRSAEDCMKRAERSEGGNLLSLELSQYTLESGESACTCICYKAASALLTAFRNENPRKIQESRMMGLLSGKLE